MGIDRILESHVPFSTEEFCIDGAESSPSHVKEKIWRYHISPVINVRRDVGLPLTASEKSCYRPFKWEIKQGRGGGSQHTFGERSDGTFDEDNLGACDWSFWNKADRTPENLNKLYYSLMAHTKYTRLAIYNTFIHCDYKARDGFRYLYNARNSGWEFVDKVELL